MSSKQVSVRLEEGANERATALAPRLSKWPQYAGFRITRAKVRAIARERGLVALEAEVVERRRARAEANAGGE